MRKFFSHWLRPDQLYQPADIALLLAGIDPYAVGKNPETNSDNPLVLLNRAKEQKLNGWEQAFFYYSLVIQAMRMGDIDVFHPTRISFDALRRFFKLNDIQEFPKGCPLSYVSIDSTKSDNTTSKETYLSIIGALVTVLAELDETKERPFKSKKLVRADGISAKAAADIISKRFEECNLPLKRSNTAISEALKLIEGAEKACT